MKAMIGGLPCCPFNFFIALPAKSSAALLEQMVKHRKKKKPAVPKRVQVTQLANKEKGLESRINRLRACILRAAEELGETRREKNRIIDEIHVERQVEGLAVAMDGFVFGSSAGEVDE
jgi:hypothetical protein